MSQRYASTYPNFQDKMLGPVGKILTRPTFSSIYFYKYGHYDIFPIKFLLLRHEAGPLRVRDVT